MFVTDATIIALSGVLLSPNERRIHASRLYSITIGTPANIIRR